MTVVVGGSSPQITFADSTVQNTAALPLTGGSVSADITVNGLTVGKGAYSSTQSTALGVSALASSNSSSDFNTAVGYQSAYSTTSGQGNTFLGRKAGYSNTSANDNTAIGNQALYTNSTGTANVAIGQNALYSNTATGSTAIGYQAGYTNSTGGSFVAVGYRAGYTYNGSETNGSVFVGYSAGLNVTSGHDNCFVGGFSGNTVTTGSNNTILGAYSGNQGGLDIRTSSNYIVLSDGAGNPKIVSSSTTAFIAANSTFSNNLQFDSNEFYPNIDNTIKLGYPANRWTTVYATTSTINTSDANTKQDIANLDDAEKRVAVAIKSLIKKYRFKDAVAKKGNDARIHIGAISQEVQAAFVTESLDPARYGLFCSDTWYEVDGKPKNDEAFYTAETEGAVEITQLGLRYEELLAFVISAL